MLIISTLFACMYLRYTSCPTSPTYPKSTDLTPSSRSSGAHPQDVRGAGVPLGSPWAVRRHPFAVQVTKSLTNERCTPSSLALRVTAPTQQRGAVERLVHSAADSISSSLLPVYPLSSTGSLTRGAVRGCERLLYRNTKELELIIYLRRTRTAVVRLKKI